MSSILAGGAKSTTEKPSKIKAFRRFYFCEETAKTKNHRFSLANFPSANGQGDCYERFFKLYIHTVPAPVPQLY